jgi:hypothetical protein
MGIGAEHASALNRHSKRTQVPTSRPDAHASPSPILHHATHHAPKRNRDATLRQMDWRQHIEINLTPETVRACMAYAAEILKAERVYPLSADEACRSS